MFTPIHNPTRKVDAYLPEGQPCHLARSDSPSLEWLGQGRMPGPISQSEQLGCAFRLGLVHPRRLRQQRPDSHRPGPPGACPRALEAATR